MSLTRVFAVGIEQVVREAEESGRLRRLLADARLPEDAGEHIRATLQAMPALLLSINDAIEQPDAPMRAKRLFRTVISYLVKEHDLVPMTEGRPLLGLLDDAYLLHRSAVVLKADLRGLLERNVAGGMDLLASVLPRGVVTALNELVAAAYERRRPTLTFPVD
ncbi:MAG: hypothetical protein D6689_19840 [Deltaproteobacteria bacterium]|nr:MAG: hypothetical protein D6689_19840 [Deltaproteobacteria bacterium]